jgi:hypothetical protein
MTGGCFEVKGVYDEAEKTRRECRYVEMEGSSGRKVKGGKGG